MRKTLLLSACCVSLAFASVMFCATNQAAILPQLPSSPKLVVSTVPDNGDVNPYGVAFVPQGFASGGTIHPGDVIVSNFNASSNLQGTGTTIVSISLEGKRSLFFQGPTGLGLTTALVALRKGVVLVGNVPTTNGQSDTVMQGSLIALNRWGKQIASFTDSTFLDGPWDLQAIDQGTKVTVFVSSVLNGTVSRLSFGVSEDGEHIWLDSATEIAYGYVYRSDPNALVVGPTGVAFDWQKGVLFVAATGDNAIYEIPEALTRAWPVKKGPLVYKDEKHLRGPVGLILAPNGHLITTNGDAINGNPEFPSEMIEFTTDGEFVAQLSVDLGGEGGAFGLAAYPDSSNLKFAAVDDVANTVEIWELKN